MKKNYNIELIIKGYKIPMDFQSALEEGSPHFREEIKIAIEKAADKILETNEFEASQIDTIKCRKIESEHSSGNVLEIKLYDIEIKTKEGKSYSLKEYTHPNI